MKTLIETAHGIQGFLEGKEWPFCFIGGIALMAWGRPRLTVDIDLSIYTGFGKEAPFIDSLLNAYAPRIQDAREFANATRVLLLQSRGGIGLDVVLSALPYEAEIIKRAAEVEFLPTISLRVCGAEDLVVLKAFAARTQDWADVESIARRQRGALDATYIMERLKPLAKAKETPDILTRVKGLLSDFS